MLAHIWFCWSLVMLMWFVLAYYASVWFIVVLICAYWTMLIPNGCLLIYIWCVFVFDLVLDIAGLFGVDLLVDHWFYLVCVDVHWFVSRVIEAVWFLFWLLVDCFIWVALVAMGVFDVRWFLTIYIRRVSWRLISLIMPGFIFNMCCCWLYLLYDYLLTLLISMVCGRSCI